MHKWTSFEDCVWVSGEDAEGGEDGEEVWEVINKLIEKLLLILSEYNNKNVLLVKKN